MLGKLSEITQFKPRPEDYLLPSQALPPVYSSQQKMVDRVAMVALPVRFEYLNRSKSPYSCLPAMNTLQRPFCLQLKETSDHACENQVDSVKKGSEKYFQIPFEDE